MIHSRDNMLVYIKTGGLTVELLLILMSWSAYSSHDYPCGDPPARACTGHNKPGRELHIRGGGAVAARHKTRAFAHTLSRVTRGWHPQQIQPIPKKKTPASSDGYGRPYGRPQVVYQQATSPKCRDLHRNKAMPPYALYVKKC